MNSFRLPLILEPEALAELLGSDKLLIVDCSLNEFDYMQGHVPGAVYLPGRAMVAGTPPAPGELPTPAMLNRLFGYLGLAPDSHVVAYDDEGGGWAGRLLWTLDVIGHSRYSYLNGGILAWRAAGLPLEAGDNTPRSRAMEVSITEGAMADKDYILRRMQDKDFVVWDARSPQEYRGERGPPGRSGHIPGAKNYEWTRGMDQARQLRLRDLERIRSELAALGITADKEIVTHCQSHHRSGFTYLLGKALGFERIKAYPGSWADWSSDPEAPVATGNDT